MGPVLLLHVLVQPLITRRLREHVRGPSHDCGPPPLGRILGLTRHVCAPLAAAQEVGGDPARGPGALVLAPTRELAQQVGRLLGWLIDWLMVAWVAGWLVDWLGSRSRGRPVVVAAPGLTLGPGHQWLGWAAGMLATT